MASLELGELAHEGSSDIGIDLAVKKDWPVGFPKLRRELVQVLQRADVAASKPKLSAIGAKSTSGNTDLVTGCCLSLRKCSSAP
jgi:hypothetical protein